MLAMASKRVRSPKWDDTETTLLAKLKREAFLQGQEGSHVWHEISRSISGRSAIQCQRRWETLVKVHSHVQEYCTQTGQDHEELDDAELASMRLETAYRRDWYIIVEEVCSERKRRRISDRGAAAMLSKGSSTAVMETLSTTRPVTTDDPVIVSLDSDCENNTVFQSREILDFDNHVGQVAISMVCLAHYQLCQDLLKSSYSISWTTSGQDPLEDVRETADVTVKTPPEIEYAESNPVHSGLLAETPNDAQCNGAVPEEEGTFDSKTGRFNFEKKPPRPNFEVKCLYWSMARISLSTAESIKQFSASAGSKWSITKQSIYKIFLEELDTNLDLQAAFKVITSPDSDCENITMFHSRKTLDSENHVGQVALSMVRWAPNSPRWYTVASSLSGCVDATDEQNLQVEQTWPELEFLVPEGLWPEYPRYDQGLFKAGNFSSNCFSPPISFPLCFSPENQYQEHQHKKRRGYSKWNLDESDLLAGLIRKAFRHDLKVWNDIPPTISCISTCQCFTVLKLYIDVQDCWIQTGQEKYEELDDAELASMKLLTAYRRHTYIVGKDVCIQSIERLNCDRVAAVKVSKGSSTPVMEFFPYHKSGNN